MEEDEWKNLVRVSDYLVDSTSFMDIKLDSDLISKYTGYDSQKMAELKIQLKDNPEKINDLLMVIKPSLININISATNVIRNFFFNCFRV